MEELITAIIPFLVEVFFEVVLQLIAESGIDLIDRWFRNLVSDAEPWSRPVAAIGYFLLGIIFGVLSIFVAPHALVRPSKIHGISMLISPLITGLIMSRVGTWVRRRDRQSARIESFAYGATFAFGVALVRFFWL
jgi:hypothetical protein